MDIKHYWDNQSQGYSDLNQEELNSGIRDVWVRLIRENVSEREELSVLDVGCGPGFLAVIMAQQGYRVTAVDFSKEMLKQAEKNAALYCPDRKIRFLTMDAQKLDFKDGEFDLVVSRNIMWKLRRPKEAYKEWIRVLRPGGRILNFDGNWRLYLYHPYLRRLNEKAKEDCIRRGWEVIPDGHDRQHAGDALDELPLADKIRPYWDVDCLTEFENVRVTYSERLPEGIMDEYYTLLYRYMPMFMVCAEKLQNGENISGESIND